MIKSYLHQHNLAEHWVLSWIFVQTLNSEARKEAPKRTVAGHGVLQRPPPPPPLPQSRYSKCMSAFFTWVEGRAEE